MAQPIIEESAVELVSIPMLAKPQWRGWRSRAFKLFAAGMLAIAFAAALVMLLDHAGIGGSGLYVLSIVIYAAGTICLAAAFVNAALALVQLIRARETGTLGAALGLGFAPLLVGGVFTGAGFFFAWMAAFGFVRGRQLRKRGKVMLAPVAAGAGWARLELPARAPDELRTQLAARWRENGRTEHASVAAFARLTLDLMALGAPARLIEDANRDSLDEIRHADLCFSLARALDGKSESPARFPRVRGSLPAPRRLALARLAVESLIDGALHEGLSARVLARVAKRCEDPEVREVVLELARDEGRHAAHGWDVVEWCLAEGGAPVAQALLGSLRAIRKRAVPGGEGAFEAYGLHGQALEAEEHEKARLDVVAKVQKLAAEVH